MHSDLYRWPTGGISAFAADCREVGPIADRVKEHRRRPCEQAAEGEPLKTNLEPKERPFRARDMSATFEIYTSPSSQ